MVFRSLCFTFLKVAMNLLLTLTIEQKIMLWGVIVSAIGIIIYRSAKLMAQEAIALVDAIGRLCTDLRDDYSKFYTALNIKIKMR